MPHLLSFLSSFFLQLPSFLTLLIVHPNPNPTFTEIRIEVKHFNTSNKTHTHTRTLSFTHTGFLIAAFALLTQVPSSIYDYLCVQDFIGNPFECMSLSSPKASPPCANVYAICKTNRRKLNKRKPRNLFQPLVYFMVTFNMFH